MQFQSLFFWIHFYNQWDANIEALEWDLFQSLFFWIHFYNDAGRVASRRARPGFNPCFSGFTSTTQFLDDPSNCSYRFQSLFFWIHFYN